MFLAAVLVAVEGSTVEQARATEEPFERHLTR